MNNIDKNLYDLIQNSGQQFTDVEFTTIKSTSLNSTETDRGLDSKMGTGIPYEEKKKFKLSATYSGGNIIATISFVGAYTSFYYYIDNKKFIVTESNISAYTQTAAASEGTYFFYINQNTTDADIPVMVLTKTPWRILDPDVLLWDLYFNASDNTITWIGMEKHTYGRDIFMHARNHAQGAVYHSGLLMSQYNGLTNFSGNTDNNFGRASVQVAGGYFFDEDIKNGIAHSDTALTSTTASPETNWDTFNYQFLGFTAIATTGTNATTIVFPTSRTLATGQAVTVMNGNTTTVRGTTTITTGGTGTTFTVTSVTGLAAGDAIVIGARIPIYYISAVAGSTYTWRKLTATDFLGVSANVAVDTDTISTATCQYNNATTGGFSTMSANRYYPIYLLATNFISEPVIAILGQGQSTNGTLSTALGEAPFQFSNLVGLSALEIQEVVPFYRLVFIYNTSGGFSNSHIRLASATWLDVRVATVSGTVVSGGSISDHALLSNRDWILGKHTGVAETFATFDSGGNPSNINTNSVAYLSGASFTGSISATNLSGTNTGDQVGDGVTITGTGTVGDPFVATSGPGGGATIIEKTHAQLLVMKNDLTLTAGQLYKITDFATKHIIPNTLQINEGPIENLILTATGLDTFDIRVQSIEFPNDIIEYDITDTSCEDGTWSVTLQKYSGGTARKGKITYRKDSVYNLETHYDWRNVKFRRWEIDALPWVDSQPYVKYDIAKGSDNNIYVCKRAVTGSVDPSSDTTNWQLCFDLSLTNKLSWTSDKNNFDVGNITNTNLVIPDIPYDILQPIQYGYLYNYFAYNDPLFAVSGWHVPTQAEFETLQTYLGGNTVAGGKLKETGDLHWNFPNDATNESSFNGRGSGLRGDDGSFNLNKTDSFFATTTYNNPYVTTPNISYNSTELNIGTTDQKTGLVVRLLADVPGDWETNDTVTDYDGNIYTVIVIGTQAWLQQNWACTSLNDGTPLTKVTNNITWAGLTTEGYCSYNNDDRYAINTSAASYHDYYTFSIMDELTNSSGIINGTGTGDIGLGYNHFKIGNIEKTRIDYDYGYTLTPYNNIVFYLSPNNSNEYYCYSNFINSMSFESTINANLFYNNKINEGFSRNIINNNDFNHNNIGVYFKNNVIQSLGYNNITQNFVSNIIHNSFLYNSIYSDFYNNIIQIDFTYNTINTDFYSNVIGSNFYYNNIQNDFTYNIIGDNFRNNRIGNSFQNIIITVDFQYNTCGDFLNFNGIDFSSATIVSSSYDKQIFKNSLGTIRLSYFDNSDVLTVVNVNA